MNMLHEEIKFLEALELDEPWPHTVIDNFFSKINLDVIKTFFNNFVPDEKFIEQYEKVKVSSANNLIKYAKSKIFALNKKDNHNCFLTLTEKSLQKFSYLENLVNIFKSKEIINKICNHRKDELIKKSILRIQLIRDVKGYSIKPHPDSERKLFTFQCYFPYKENNLGTSLYDQNLNYVKAIPYKENTAYWFIPKQKGVITWHGFEGKTIECRRDSIMVNYVCDNEDGIKL